LEYFGANRFDLNNDRAVPAHGPPAPRTVSVGPRRGRRNSIIHSGLNGTPVRVLLCWSWSLFGADNFLNRRHFLFHPFPQRTGFVQLKYGF
jgi:hypothetical protein